MAPRDEAVSVVEFLDSRASIDTATEQFSPSVAFDDGQCLASWTSYKPGNERIDARFFDSISLEPDGPACTLAESGHDPISVFVDGSPMVVWIGPANGSSRAKDGNEFENEAIYCRSYDGSDWNESAELVTEASILAFDVEGGADLIVAWIAMTQFAVETLRVLRYADGDKAESFDIESRDGRSTVNRPSVSRLSQSDGDRLETRIGVAYDRYHRGKWSIRYAEIGEDDAVTIENVSDSDSRDFSPAIAVDKGGSVFAAWIALTDVVDENGIVDQNPTIRGATKKDGRWSEILDQAGSKDLASLGWGLLSISGAPVWGYLGRRRKPLVLAGRDVWICWERKSEHSGPTSSTGGLLCGVRIRDRTIEPPRVIATGPRWYHPVVDSSRSEDRIIFVGRADPDDSTKELIIDQTGLGESAPLDDPATYDNWQPVRVETLVPDTKQFANTRTGAVDAPHATRGVVRDSVEDFVVDFVEDPPYWADLHVHSGLSSDAEGFVDELVSYARDSARIDVLLLQDNDHYQLTLTDSEYEYLLRRIERFTVDGEFVAIPGFEWTYFEGKDRRPSHRTVFGKSSAFPLLRNTEVGSDPMGRFAAYAASNDAMVHIHHERFSLLPNAIDQNMEICSGWHLHMAKLENRRYYHNLLGEGNRIGFIGGSDNHRRNPGMGGALTGIFADELSRDSVVSALQNHRCFATNGARIVPRFEVDGGRIGDRIEAGRTTEITASIGGLPTQARISVYRDGAVIDERSVEPPMATFSFQDGPLEPGSHYYYLEVDAQSEWKEYPSNLAPAIGGMAWTSPIWVDVK